MRREIDDEYEAFEDAQSEQYSDFTTLSSAARTERP